MPFVTKARTPADPTLRGLTAGMTSYERQVYEVYFKALNNLKKQLGDRRVLKDILSAIEAGNPADAAVAFNWREFIPKLEPAIQIQSKQVADLANKTAKTLPRNARFDADFKASDPRAIAWAQQRAGLQIKNITAETQKAVSGLIVDALRMKRTREEIITMLTQTVGLDNRQSRALGNYYVKTLDKFLEDGLSYEDASARAKKLGERYQKRLLKQRATRIARTEIAAAANAGRYLSWQEADSLGLVTAGSKKRWITAGDERTCPICGPMNGKEISWESPWEFGDLMPPVHPNCRCAAVLVMGEIGVIKRYYSAADGEETWQNYDYKWRKISEEIREERGKCERCGSTKDLTVEHKKRLRDGGAKYDRSNLRVLCRSCNGRKARLGTKLRKAE